MVPKVTIMGLALSHATSTPLITPQKNPTKREITSVLIGYMPALIVVRNTIPTKETIDPTERSKLPLIIIQVMPQVTIPTIDAWRKTFRKLLTVRKYGLRKDIKMIKPSVKTRVGSARAN